MPIKPLWDMPEGYRLLQEGETVRAGDVVCSDLGGPEFKIGPNHLEIGAMYDATCVTIIREINKR